MTMSRRTKKTLVRICFGLFCIGALFALGGCAPDKFPVIYSDGPVAGAERNLLFIAVLLMLIVVVPVWVMAVYFTRHYRASNTQATYMPDWASSTKIEAVMWLVPVAIVAVLSVLVFIYSRKLDPYAAITSNKPPLHVEAISLDWKWVFIYPGQHIATVNKLVIPTGTPVSMKLTSDTVMDSLYIPGLVGQMYTMAGMQTRLNMLAKKPGHFIGRNTNFSGKDFPDQRFAVAAVPAAGFRAWIKQARQSSKSLNAAAYARLEQPGTSGAITYSAVEPNLFYKVIAKYNASLAKLMKKKQSGKSPASSAKQPFVS